MARSESELSKLVDQMRRSLEAARIQVSRLERQMAQAYPNAMRPRRAATGSSYDNAASGLTADNVQDAIDEIDTTVDGHTTSIGANFAQIATNTANIATNTSNISTNTSNISTNTADITALEAATKPEATWNIQFSAENIRFQDTGSGTLALATPSVETPTDHTVAYSYLGFGGTQKRIALMEFAIPPEWDIDGYQIDVDLYYVLNGEVFEGDQLEWEGHFRCIGNGEAMTGGATDTFAQVVEIHAAGHVTGDLVVTTISEALTRTVASEGDLIKFTLFRDATAGNTDDTYASGVRLTKVVVRGTMRTETLV